MARKDRNKGFGNSSNNDSQKTKGERIDAFRQKQADKIDASLITEERVAAKLQELENEKQRLNEEYESKKSTLDSEYDAKKQELDLRELELNAQKEDQDKREKNLEDAETQLKSKCESAVEDEIKKIRDDERRIRDEEKETIYKEWEADKKKQQEELDKYVIAQRTQIDSELESAHIAKVEAEKGKLEKIHEADEEIQAKYAELTETYTAKITELTEKKKEYEHKLLELEEEQAEVEADQEYIADLKKKYNQYSEKEVLRLQQELDHMKSQLDFYVERIKELSEQNAKLESTVLDDNGQSMSVRIQELEAKLEEAIKLNNEYANLPSDEEITRLRENTRELEALRVVVDEEKQRRHEAEAKISAYALSARELENARVASAALESLNNQLQMKLRYISEQYKSNQESKFKVLLDIDKSVGGLFNPSGFNKSLEELCEYIRNYGAYKKGLYYSIDNIRVFIASLAASEDASRLLILQGLSGTGKSSLPRLVAEALGVECKLVPVQPSWRDNRELLGYDNDFTNRFKETEFTKYLYEASATSNRQKIYLIVLDEMNLARIEYYFADFLAVLEKTDKDQWMIPLVSGYAELDDDQKPKYLNYANEAANICVTNNIWFIGTANNDDSTSLITDKVYDRAQVLDMDKREASFKGKRVAQISMGLDELLGLFNEAKESSAGLTESDWEKLSEIDEIYLKEMDITFGNRIMNQMRTFVPVFVACGGTKEGAIDYILAHKILRKLDERYEPYLISKLEELENGIQELYGNNVFKHSLEKIKKLKEKISG